MEINIKKTLEDVGFYFKNKILTGDYKFVECDEHTATILIDNKYKFRLWIANEPKDSFEIYEGLSDEFVVNLFRFKTQKERLEGWKHIKPYVLKYKKDVLKKKHKKQIEKLKKELEKLD